MLQPINPQFNSVVNRIARVLMPFGWAVSDNPPDSYDDMMKYHHDNGRICVWSGDPPTIFGDVECFRAFRAWHDWCHCAGKFDFKLLGESLTVALQSKQLIEYLGDGDAAREFVHMTNAEIMGNQFYYSRYKKSAQNPRELVTLYMTDPILALSVER